jgi:hemolysin-activating ACP:hemolysin acyltransferase
VSGPIPELTADELRKRAAAAKATTATFGEIVGLLMRSQEHRQQALADIERLVVPALQVNQASVATAQSKTNGLVAPAAVVLWARVSEDVDRRLSAAPGQPIRLSPQEWKSGDIVWVVLALGDKRVLQGMIQHLQDKEWGHKPAKTFARTSEGKPVVAMLGAQAR